MPSAAPGPGRIPQDGLPELTTERLHLRGLVAEDAGFLVRLDTDPDVMRHVHGGPLSGPEAEEFAQCNILLAGFRQTFGRWMVIQRETGERLGWIEVFRLRGPERDDMQAGYQFAPEAQGRGYAEETLRAVLAHAFAHGLDRVAAVVRADNDRSRRLLERCGFQFSGEYRPDGAWQNCELWFIYS
jgi:RimJ/RimL family protein N-acetyltransferase